MSRVFAVVVVFCFLFTISAAFEYQLITEEKFVEIKSGEPCKYNQTKVEHNYLNNVVQKDSFHDVIEVDVVGPLTTLSNNKNHINDADMVYHRIIRSLDNEVISTDYINNNNNNTQNNNDDTNNVEFHDDFIDVNDTKRDNITIIITRDEAEELTPNVNDNLCHNVSVSSQSIQHFQEFYSCTLLVNDIHIYQIKFNC